MDFFYVCGHALSIEFLNDHFLEIITADQRSVPCPGEAYGLLSLPLQTVASNVLLPVKFLIVPGRDQLLVGCDVLRALGLLTDSSLWVRLMESRSIISVARWPRPTTSVVSTSS